ncbi:MAG: PEGA domain-containing protein [Deltaproteobacteria bacterium]|nr:PEGA domain-containing protein [Deltaproteobacteria bacterium]
MGSTIAMGTVGAAAQEAEAEAPAESAEPDARELFLRGQAAYERGDYEDAVAAWEAGYALDPRPLLQYNLGQAYERLGELPKAVGAFEAYLEHASPSDPNQQRARAQLAAIRERLGRTSIVVTGGPEGATILIDGEDHGRTPRPDPIAVSPGSHQVEIVLEGYRPFEAAVSVAAGRSVDVTVAMEEEVGGSVDSGPPLVPIILWAGGGAAIVAGAILGGIALGKANGADTSDGSDADSARGLALGADIAFGVGILAAGAGLLVFLLSGDDDEADDDVALTPAVGPGFAGAMARGTF